MAKNIYIYKKYTSPRWNCFAVHGYTSLFLKLQRESIVTALIQDLGRFLYFKFFFSDDDVFDSDIPNRPNNPEPTTPPATEPTTTQEPIGDNIYDWPLGMTHNFKWV